MRLVISSRAEVKLISRISGGIWNDRALSKLLSKQTLDKVQISLHNKRWLCDTWHKLQLFGHHFALDTLKRAGHD